MTSYPLRSAIEWSLLGVPAAAYLAVAQAFPDTTWTSPVTAAVGTVGITFACAVLAAIVIVLGFARGLAEVAILGAAMWAASLLPLVHGLTVPGALYGPNTATAVAALLAMPVALAVAAPVLLPRAPFARAATLRWKTWSLLGVAVPLAPAGALLIWPNAAPAPTPGSAPALAVCAVALAGTGVLAVRQMRFYRLGGRAGSLVAAVAFASLGAHTLIWAWSEPYSSVWWAAHGLDAAGVLGVTGGLLVAHWRDRGVAEVLRPLLVRDPLAALELGVTPVMHGFIASLERKDPATRDHVVRVGELALRLGVRAGYPPRRLRRLGVGALLHDIGKLETPSEILTKPGRLDDAEFARMKEHTVVGSRIIEASPPLADAAPIVRGHHERWDGAGYPDGLRGEEIPPDAALVGVCDAWDAMTHKRVYKDDVPEETALRILQEGAGRQWSPEAVALAHEEIVENGPCGAAEFADAGRARARQADRREEDPEDVLADAMPEAALALLAR